MILKVMIMMSEKMLGRDHVSEIVSVVLRAIECRVM